MSHSVSETDGSFAVTPSISGSPFSSRSAAEEAIVAAGGTVKQAGGRHRTLKAKTLRRLLKKKGLKTTGKKSTLMKRLKMKGGEYGGKPMMGGSYGGMEGGLSPAAFAAGGVESGSKLGGRRRSRRSRRGLFGY